MNHDNNVHGLLRHEMEFDSKHTMTHALNEDNFSFSSSVQSASFLLAEYTFLSGISAYDLRVYKHHT